ncbi:MAG: hypothetical protein IT304_11120, partial [Dehalococcoidia bacterium]|nr:hypothetical protein [Dehalococcoidia bacterium]
ESSGAIGSRPLRRSGRAPSPHPLDTWREQGATIDSDYREKLSAAYGVPIGETAASLASTAGGGA